MKLKKMINIGIVVIICDAFGIGYYQYNKRLANSDMEAESISTVDLYKNFSMNENKANRVYLNKTLEVSGTVLEVKNNEDKHRQVILDTGDPMFGIACAMDDPDKTVKAGDHVTIKGVCTGYVNDDIVLVKSSLVNNYN